MGHGAAGEGVVIVALDLQLVLAEFIGEFLCQLRCLVIVALCLLDHDLCPVFNILRVAQQQPPGDGLGAVGHIQMVRGDSTLSGCQLEDLGEAVGYTIASSFRRKFKQVTKLTPSEYRSQFQQ